MRHALVAKDGTGGWARHRIPALAATPRGDLLAVHDGRHGIDDLPAPIDLVAHRSTDGGRSWGEPQVVRAGEGIDGYGDASLILDSRRRRLLLWCAASTYAGFFESGVAANDADPHVLHTDLGVSEDEGRTWTWHRKTAELREQLRRRNDPHEPVSGLFPSSGSGIQLTRGPHRGRLLQSFLLLRGSQFFLVVASSDDGGASWRFSNELGPGANESTMCELADGEVLLHSRSVGTRLTAHSADGGATFSPLEPVPELVDPGCNGSLVSWADDAGVRVVASHLADPDLRRGLVLDLSSDAGASWTERTVLTRAEAAYSTVVATTAGLAVLWEAEGTRSLICSVLDETDFLPAAESPPVSSVGFQATLRHVEPAPVEPSPHDVEVPAADPNAWGPGVYKMAAPTPDGVQRIRSRAGLSPDFGDTLLAGETLVMDVRLGEWSADDQLFVDGQLVPCDRDATESRSVEGGAVEGGAVEGGAAEGGAVEGGAAEGGAVEGGAAEGGAVEGGAVEGGAVTFGVRRPITPADLASDPLVVAFASRREDASASQRFLGTLAVSLRAGSLTVTSEGMPGR